MTGPGFGSQARSVHGNLPLARGIRRGGRRRRMPGHGTELWNQTPHRMGLPAEQAQSQLPGVQRGGNERVPGINHTPHWYF